MIVDFHTHTFPDKIADKAINNLAATAKIKPYRNGTAASLKESMRRCGIDISVVLQVATSARQVAHINELSAQLNGKDGLFFSGAIHPDTENIDEVLDGIKNAGLFGIKLHPDYQGVRFDDERNIRIMDAAAKRGLITVTHAGVDLSYIDDVHCTPDMILNVLDRLDGVIDNRLVLAHMGGHLFQNEVMEKLVGKPVYLDTSFVLNKYPEECVELIRKHGADRVLFASDSPWADQGEFVDLFMKLPFTEEEREMMLYRNALRLLNING